MAVDATAHGPTKTIDVALKIWRFDSATRRARAQGVRDRGARVGDAPRRARPIKDKVDGSLAYRKSCRMMICGSCGMRMDGAAVLACKTRMYDIAQSGHVPVISAMGNLPIVKDLVVDMEPFWAKFKAMKPYLQPGYDQPPDGKEYVISQERMNVSTRSRCASTAAAASPSATRWSPTRTSSGRRRSRKGCASSATRATAPLERLERKLRARDLGLHALLLLHRALPEGRRPARRDREARRRGDEGGIDDDMGAKHANWFVTSAKTTGWLRETELVPKTQGIIASISQTRFARAADAREGAGRSRLTSPRA